MRKIRPFLALCALCALSCSQDDSYNVATSSDDNVIGFMNSTTRATTLTLSNLKEDDVGFAVYGVKNDSGSWDTEMSGSNMYSYVNGYWAWTLTSPMWPDEDSGEYPIDFYAIYTLADSSSGYSADTNSPGQIAITYAAPTDGQSDILVATATADARPVGDKLPLTFYHILSKVTFGITTPDNYTIYTQDIGMNNICSKRIYNLYSDSDDKWGSQVDNDIDKYPYIEFSWPAVDSSSDSFVGSYGDLMLLPQTTTSWDPDNTGSDVTGSHIFLTYRAEDSSLNDIVGYGDASDHPAYDPDSDSEYNGVALFVKVGYPIGNSDGDFVLTSGSSYNYNINLMSDGATNGYLIDEYYYDEYGKITSFVVDGKEVGDPISDGYINFTISVEEWVSSGSVDNE